MNTLVLAVLMSLAVCVAGTLLVRRSGGGRSAQRVMAGVGATIGGLGLLALAIRELT